MAAIAPIQEGDHLTGENGTSYLAVSALGSVKDGVTANVWSAVDSGTQEEVFVIKQPSANDTEKGWPMFSSEMIMHELFKDCPYIRRQVDRIPPDAPSNDGNEPPRLVLEPAETTLSLARANRPLTSAEIKVLMRGVLLGLQEIHSRGLVYADLKMDNILVNGFRNSAEETASAFLEAKLGDLGIVMPPSYGKVQPISYRAPEVFFKSLITPAADIWSWGIIFVQLLEAQVQYSEPGMYTDFSERYGENLSVANAEQSVKHCLVNDFDLNDTEYYKDCILPTGDVGHTKHSWTKSLLEKGISQTDIDFISFVLQPDPNERPSATTVLDESYWTAGDPDSGQLESQHENTMRSQARASDTTTAQAISTTLNPATGEGNTAQDIPSYIPEARSKMKHRPSPSISEYPNDVLLFPKRIRTFENVQNGSENSGNSWMQYSTNTNEHNSMPSNFAIKAESGRGLEFRPHDASHPEPLAHSAGQTETMLPMPALDALGKDTRRGNGPGGLLNPGLIDRLKNGTI